MAVRALLRDELDRGAGRAAELAAAAGAHLDVVHDRAGRDPRQRQRVADLDVRLLAGHHLHAHRQALGREDVALLAVEIVQQRDVRRAVGVVLDRGDLGGHAVLAALEVDAPVAALRAAAAVAARDAPVRVAPAGLRLALHQRLLGLRARQVVALHPGREPPRREWWACAFGSPWSTRPRPPPRTARCARPGASSTTAFFHWRVRPADQSRRLGFGFIFIVRTSTTRTLKISSTAERICVLCASVVDAERVLVLRDQGVALLRDHGAADDLAGVHYLRRLLRCSAPARRRRARGPRSPPPTSRGSLPRRRPPRPHRAPPSRPRAGCSGTTSRSRPPRRRPARARGRALEPVERLGGRRSSRARRRRRRRERPTLPRRACTLERGAQGAPARLAVHLHGVASRAWGRTRPRRRSSGAPGSSPRGHARCPSGARAWRRRRAPRCACASRRCRDGARAAPRARPRRRCRCGTARRRRRRAASRIPGRPAGERSGAALRHRAPPRPRPRGPGTDAAQDQQVAVGVDVDDLEPELGHAPVAHLAREPLALHHARRRRAGADRAGRPDVVRAVADRARGRTRGGGSCPGSPCPSRCR